MRAKFDLKDRNKVTEELFKRVLEGLSKNTIYKETVANDIFWEAAEKYNMTPEQALAVRMSEFVKGIEQFIKDPKSESLIEVDIIENIEALAVLYTILVEKGEIDHKPLQKITKSGSPLEKCSSCGATPDREGNIYHEPSCKA